MKNMKKQTKKPYFVLSEGSSTDKDFRMYYSLKEFAEEAPARDYAFENMPSLIGKKGPYRQGDNVKDENNPYVVVNDIGYGTYFMGEFEGTNHKYQAFKANSETLDSVVDRASDIKGSDRIFAGIELKLG